jgi:hypothetical protein
MASAGTLVTVTIEDQRSYINHTDIHSALCEVCGEQTVDHIQFPVGQLVFLKDVSS